MGLRNVCESESQGIQSLLPLMHYGMGGYLSTPVHSYPFYVNGNHCRMGNFDRLREKSGANASLGRK